MFGGTDSCRKCFQYGRRKFEDWNFGGNCISGSVIPWNLIYEEMQCGTNLNSYRDYDNLILLVYINNQYYEKEERGDEYENN